MHNYTQEEFKFIDEHVEGRTVAELTALVNERFGLDLKESQIKGFIARNWLSSGLDCSFKPGIVPWNKGKKGGYPGMVPTQFKPGNRPWNYMPVGSERVNAGGYLDVKIADPNVWKAKHIVVWEAANGPVPPGHVIIFGDGDPMNIVLDNLILVTRAQLVRMNQKGLIKNNVELTKTGALIADVLNKAGERKRGRDRDGARTQSIPKSSPRAAG